MYKVLLKMKKLYAYNQFLFFADQALEKGKITQEEYNQLTADAGE